MSELVLLQRSEQIDEAVSLLNKLLPLHQQILHVYQGADRQPSDACFLDTEYVRIDEPVTYDPWLPAVAHDHIFIPTGSGVCLNPRLEHNGHVYRMCIDKYGDFLRISSPEFVEHTQAVAYSRHMFLVPDRM